MSLAKVSVLACAVVSVFFAVAIAVPTKGCAHSKSNSPEASETVRSATTTSSGNDSPSKKKTVAESELAVLDGLVKKIDELKASKLQESKLASKAAVSPETKKDKAHDSDELNPDEMKKAAEEEEKENSHSTKDSTTLSLSALTNRLVTMEDSFLTKDERKGLAEYMKAKGLVPKSVRAAVAQDDDHNELLKYTGKMEHGDITSNPEREKLADTF